MKEISVVAPIFNEETTIPEFIKQVSSHLSSISSDYEIILVDDGSKDKSWEIIMQEAAKNHKIKAIKLSKNFGHHYALTAGLHNSNSKWTVVMDSDLQDRPSVIKDLYEKAIEGYEVVFVSRINRPESFIYLFAQKIFYYLLNILSGLKFDSKQANFSIINHTVVKAFKSFPENARFYGSTIRWLGFNTAEVQAEHGTRFSGKPSYTFRKRIKLAADIILAFSDRPLKFAIGFGLILAFFATIMAGWIFWGAIHSDFVVLGWPSIMAAIFFVGGSNLIVLGILGIYLGRVFREVKNRPLYIISKLIN
jgi:dolichol-phosphate mannosyltransferase